jgi:hypothetical protein
MDNIIFEAGMTLSIETYYKVHLKTNIIGWKKNEFILAEAIYVYGKPAEMGSNDRCKVFFMKDGNAYGFEAKIITVLYYPFPLLYISYPQTIECVSIGMVPRLTAEIPVTLRETSGTVISEAFMLDLSDTGCELKAPIQKDMDILSQTTYSIKINLMDKELNIDCRLIKIVQHYDIYSSLSMDFVNISALNRETLKMFLDFLNRYAARPVYENAVCRYLYQIGSIVDKNNMASRQTTKINSPQPVH